MIYKRYTIVKIYETRKKEKTTTYKTLSIVMTTFVIAVCLKAILKTSIKYINNKETTRYM
jgi:hypothetical protein